MVHQRGQGRLQPRHLLQRLPGAAERPHLWPHPAEEHGGHTMLKLVGRVVKLPPVEFNLGDFLIGLRSTMARMKYQIQPLSFLNLRCQNLWAVPKCAPLGAHRGLGARNHGHVQVQGWRPALQGS